MESCDPVGTPMEIKDKLDLDQNGTPVDATKYHSMIGALMYLTSSRLDIVHVTCLCDRYQAKPTEKHLKEVKRIFRYLRGTINTGLWYTKDSGFELTGFSDAYYAGCKDTFKSTSSGAQFLGEKLVSWSSKKQDCTALSTAEAEYVSLSACCAQVLWMRTQLTNYGFHFNKIPIYYDSKSAIAISCNPVQHSRTKHIVVRYHFIKEHVEKGTIELYFIKTDYQLADIFTKALPVDRFNYLVCHLGSDDGVTTSFQLSQNSRPPCSIIKDKYMMKAQVIIIRQVLHYVKGTKDYGITYEHNGGNKIHGFSDNSYGVNTQEGKGTTGIIFYYGESPISWSIQKQAIVALSLCESEFITSTVAATQALWLKRLLSKLTHSQEEKVTIQVDNKSAISLMKNPVFHGRIKHIDTKYHFIRECVEREDIQVEFISEEYQKANILTKALPKIKFLTMRQLIRLKDLHHSVCD
nr:copia protein [Tanacetum cinerariifolium]